MYLRLRFHKTSSKFDEDVETTSHRVAPLGSRTLLTIDEEGLSASPVALPSLLLTEVLRRKLEHLSSVTHQRQALLNVTDAVNEAGASSDNVDFADASPSMDRASRDRSESHLVVRRRASYVHHQSSVLRRLFSSLTLAAMTAEPVPATASESSDTVASTPTHASSLQSTLSMPFNAIKTLVASTKSADSHLGESKHGVALNEPVAGDGCVGIANLGNTCYMCAALQCLSHTPLLRHFFISGRFQSELNRSNPLGTGGIIAQEFAHLMKMLWSSKGHVAPSRFKKSLGKCKAQFSGNDQNDAQEFLAELLDMLHEDLNRVAVKRYIEAPSDEGAERMTFTQQAEEAWSRHIARNRSVLVDLFQGQLCSEISCPCCSKVSRTFDPFMFLSVPLLAKQHESKVYVTVVRRMRVMRLGDTPAIDREVLLNSYATNRNPSRFCITLPRLGDVNSLKQALARLTGIPPQHMRAVIAMGRRILRSLQEGDSLLEIAEFGGSKCLVYEAVIDVPFLSTVSISRLNNRRAAGKVDPSDSPELVRSEGYSDKDEYARGRVPWEGDIIVDIGSARDGDRTAYWDKAVDPAEASALFWPQRVSEFSVGMRVDATDMRGQWFPGCVEEVHEFTPQRDGSPLLSSSASEGAQRERYVRVHFDSFSSLWDEWFSEEDLAKQHVKRVYTHSERKIKLIELVVIHRKSAWETKGGAVELFGLPIVIHCESVRSCKHALRLITEQSTRYMSRLELMRYMESESKRGTAEEDSSFALPFKVRMLSTLRPLVTGRELDESRENGDVHPSKKSHKHEASTQQEWEGSLFPSSSEVPLCNIYHQNLIVAMDWNEVEDAKGGSKQSRDVPYVDHEDYVASVMELNNVEGKKENGYISYRAPDAFSSFLNHGGSDSVDLHDCLKAFTNPEVLDEETWYCGDCKTHRRGLMRTSIYRLPDILVIHVKRFSMTAKRREKIRTKVEFPLVSLNMSAYMSSEGSESTGGTMYDLYGVANHIGDMTRGHYTAFVNCQGESSRDMKGQPSSARFDAEHTPSGRGRWFLFDDDLVEEVPPSRIVSSSAYVLFYKRRRLTPSNIINMTA